MSEHAPGGGEGMKGKQDEVTKDELVRAVRGQSERDKESVLLDWRIQQMEKRRDAATTDEMIAIYMETARTLAEAGLIQDARESYEDIANMAEGFNDPEAVQEAIDEIAKLPTLH